MSYCFGRIHLKNRQKYRLGQIEFKTSGGRPAWVRPCKPFRPAMIGGRPEFSRAIPRSSMLWVDTALEKIVRARLIRSMMQSDRVLRLFFFRLIGARHNARPGYCWA